MVTQRGSGTLSQRWFRLMLRFYPQDFRDEMGDDLVETYLDRARAAHAKSGPLAVAGVWFSALIDSARNGPGERARPAAGWRRGGNWGRDAELAVRRLVRAPVFALTMIATLTVGLGAFAVVYTVFDRVLVAPLPYEDPDDLYFVWRDYTWFNFGRGWVAGPDVAALREEGSVIMDAAGVQRTFVTLTGAGGGEPMEVPSMTTSPNLFELLGVRPLLGRTFAPEETGPDRPTVAVLTHRLWQRLGADPGLVGTEIRINGNPWTVIGVMPEDFRFVRNASLGAPQPADIFVPWLTPFAEMNPGGGSLATVIRVRPGTSPERVEAAVAAVGRMLDERDHDSRGLRLYPTPAKADLIAPVRPAITVLAIAGAFLLLVLLVNLGTLLLARAAHREQEYAVSRALGANQFAVVRATLLEAGLLGLLGGIGGAVAAVWGTRALVALAPADLPRLETIAMDLRIGMIVVALGALIGLLGGIAPALWAVRTDLATLMGSTRVRGGGGRVRMRRAMVVVQVALSVVLLTAGALVVRSFEGLLRTQPGFEVDGTLTLRVPVPAARYPEPEDVQNLHARLHEALAALPGVTTVGAGWTIPVSAGMSQTSIRWPGAPGNTGDDEHDNPMIDWLAVRPGWFEALGVPVLQGEVFREAADAPADVVIDESLARQFFPDGTAVGAMLPFMGEERRVIGVVGHVRLEDVHQDGRGQVFVRNVGSAAGNSLSWVIRSPRATSSAGTLASEARAAVRRVDPELAVSDVRTMREVVDAALSQQRLTAVLIGGFSIGALLLAAMGLYGVVAGAVTKRRHELAVRLALGASHGGVLRLVMREGAVLVAFGLLLGVPGVLFAGRLLQGILVDVSAYDAATLAAVGAGLWLVAMLACWVPARRVLGIEPAKALRQE
jgi:putative ABC transport system permease protein